LANCVAEHATPARRPGSAAEFIPITTAPYYEVAEISVKDQTGYEASGVDKIRDAMKANGGKVIAGGYNKAESLAGAPPANRFLIIVYPSKEASKKTWADAVAPWSKEIGKYADFRSVGVEAVEQK
jgi:uncharacterized protein (DUF1330 family)